MPAGFSDPVETREQQDRESCNDPAPDHRALLEESLLLPLVLDAYFRGHSARPVRARQDAAGDRPEEAPRDGVQPAQARVQ